MILNSEKGKAYNLNVNGKRVYRAYRNGEMFFSSYVIPSRYIFINKDGVASTDVDVKSNTEWKVN